jgi:hypothetical protein
LRKQLLHLKGSERSDLERNAAIKVTPLAVMSRPKSKLNLSENEMKILRKSTNRMIAPQRHKTLSRRELLDGQGVKLNANQSVCLWVPWTKSPLKLFISSAANRRIKGANGNFTIHFLPETVALKVGSEIVFSRSNVFMESGQGAGLWRIQIKKELGFNKREIYARYG